LDESNTKLFPRFSVDQVKAALIDTPAVMVTGPRQCGKTALVRGFTVIGTSPWTTIQCWKLLGAIRADSYVDLIKPLSMKCNALQIYCVPSRKPSTSTAAQAASF
jgi:hypothetical protein